MVSATRRREFGSQPEGSSLSTPDITKIFQSICVFAESGIQKTEQIIETGRRISYQDFMVLVQLLRAQRTSKKIEDIRIELEETSIRVRRLIPGENPKLFEPDEENR